MTLKRMQQRRGTEAEWAAANTVLANGEIGFVTGTASFKIGDGVTPWFSLPTALGDTMAPISALWTPNTVYKAGQIVVQVNQAWKAKVDFTSGAVFNAANWDLLVPGTELASSENNTGVNITTTDATGTLVPITGLSVAVPASPLPVYLELEQTFGHTVDGAILFAVIKEVPNGTDTPVAKTTACSFGAANGIFPLHLKMRLGSTVRTRNFAAYFGMFTAGTGTANVGSGTNNFDYESSLRAFTA